MLIDSFHKRWLGATAFLTALALGLYFFLDSQSPNGLTGGSRAGLLYGIFGTALMIYAGLLSALRKAPKWTWLGARKTWLRGHIWMGLLSGVLILCHSGFSWGGPLELVLWIVLIGILVTGVIGVVLQQILPRMMTSRVATEAPYEQIPHLCQVMRLKADELIDSLCGPYDHRAPSFDNTMAAVQYRGDVRAQLRDFYEHDLRPFLASTVAKSSPMLNQIQAEARFSKLRSLPGMEEISEEVDKLESLSEERRLLWEQERLHFWLHSWMLLHIPLAVALLVLGGLHIVTALYF